MGTCIEGPMYRKYEKLNIKVSFTNCKWKLFIDFKYTKVCLNFIIRFYLFDIISYVYDLILDNL